MRTLLGFSFNLDVMVLSEDDFVDVGVLVPLLNFHVVDFDLIVPATS